MINNFMEAGTLISDLLDKKGQINDKIANILSEVIINRVKSGKKIRSNNSKYDELKSDIDKVLGDMSDAEKNDILIKIIENIAANGNFSNRNVGSTSNRNNRRNDDDDVMKDIFGSRGF